MILVWGLVSELILLAYVGLRDAVARISRLSKRSRAACNARTTGRADAAISFLTEARMMPAVFGRGRMGTGGIVNLAARGILVVSVARRLGSESPLLAYCVAPL